MDRKSIAILVASFALILLWPNLMRKLYPPPPGGLTNSVSLVTNGTTATSPVISAVSTNAIRPAPPAGPEQLLTVTNEDAIYTFSSRGGGLKLVELRRYPEAVSCARDVAGTNRYASLNTRAMVSVLAMGGAQNEGDFALTRSAAGIHAEQTLPNGLALVKDYELGSNYLVRARTRIENRSTQALLVPRQEWAVGTATPMSPTDSAQDVSVFWYNGVKAEEVNEGWFANRTLGCLPGTPRTEYRGGANNVVWSAVHNQFFLLAVIPGEPAQEIVSHRIDLPAPTATDISANSRVVARPVGYQTSIVYPASALEPGKALERNFTIYAGPREFGLLSILGSSMKNNLDLTMNYNWFSGWSAKALLLSMNGLHSMGLNYALAIIAITIIIKAVFWPLTTASTRSMKRMQMYQPQIKALQEKYKDDPRKAQTKMMEFYKEHKINPATGCLPMLIQIPVFIGFYTMIRSAIELRGVHFLWACDLSQPDTVMFLGGFPVNPLPIIYGATLLYQAHIAPAAPGMDPAQQKMMKYMPVIFLFILYNMSAGLTLYWTVQNLLTILQTKVTKAREANEPAVAAPARPPLKRK